MADKYLDNEKFEHLPADEYGAGKDVTVELLEREGKDIEYLYRMVEQLFKEGSVVTTVDFEEPVDSAENSFCMSYDSNKKEFVLSDASNTYLSFNVNGVEEDTLKIDDAKSKTVNNQIAYTNDPNKGIVMKQHLVKNVSKYGPYLYQYKNSVTINDTTKTVYYDQLRSFRAKNGNKDYDGANTYYNVSWDPNKKYAPITRNYKDPFNVHFAEYYKKYSTSKVKYSNDIPTIARAQTFVVPSNTLVKPARLKGRTINGNSYADSDEFESGEVLYLQKLYLKLLTHPQTASPLRVELRECEIKNRNYTTKTWDSTNKKYVTKTVTHKVNYPSGSIVAYKDFNFDNELKTQTERTIQFNKKIAVKAGKEYAIVLRSPLTTYDKAFGWGGWDCNCDTDPYQWGNAFTSYDNGETWNLYGRNNKGETISDNKHIAPRDYDLKYELTTPTVSDTSYTQAAQTNYIYFQKIQVNPAQEFQISYVAKEGASGNTIQFQYSYDNETWLDIGNDASAIASLNGSMFLFLRCRVYTAAITSDNVNDFVTPVIKQVEVNIVSKPATTGYLRTKALSPQIEPSLGINQWNSVDTEVLQDDETLSSYDIDVVSGSISTEQFKLINPEEISQYSSYITNQADQSSILDLAVSFYAATSDTERESFRHQIADILVENQDKYVNKKVDYCYNKNLQENGIYILYDGLMPKCKYKDVTGSWIQRFYVPLVGEPAYPAVSLTKEQISTTENITTEDMEAFAEERSAAELSVAVGTEQSWIDVYENYKTVDIGGTTSTTSDVTKTEWLDFIIAYNRQDQSTSKTGFPTYEYYKASGSTTVSATSFDFTSTFNEETRTAEPLKFENMLIFQSTLGNEEGIKQGHSDLFEADSSTDPNDSTATIKPLSLYGAAKTTYDSSNGGIYTTAEPGLYTLRYNPVIVKDLQNDEFPFNLAYKTEKFIVVETSEEIKDNYDSENDIREHYITDTNGFKLYMPPNKKLRKVRTYTGTEETETELTEGVDFTVDYNTKTVNLNEDLELEVGEYIIIEYIPNVRDQKLSLAYRLERENSTTSIGVSDYSYSYRT